MPRRFAQLTYTGGVKAAQARYGTRLEAERWAAGPENAELGEREREFVAARDSFYLATASESGWPHVQHRGGAVGFLKALDAGTLAFADLRGNLQYQTVGNLAGNDRVCLILVDYAARRRLKILGRARVVDIVDVAGSDGDALASLAVVGLSPADAAAAGVERVLFIAVEAFAWNCARYIAPRHAAVDPGAGDPEIPFTPATPKEKSMKLYDLELSGNCYKVRLFAALARIPLDIVAVDFLAGAHKQPPLIDLNPWGEIPILEDGDVVLRDSQAILVYLAAKYAGEAWLPRDAAGMAEVMQWLSTAANEVQNGPASARLVDKFGYALDKADTLKRAARILPLIEGQLAQRDWLALGRPTIADCAVFPYVALAPEGGVSLADYPHIRQWLARVKALPDFLGMPGV